MTQAETLLQAARNAGAIIATAESCTGGMVAAAITDIAGSSAIFDRGFVTYTNAAKIDMLGVKQATLDAFGAVSEQVAQEMAAGAAQNSNATIAVSITGIAGPGGSDHKPEGRVCFGLCYQEKTTSLTVEFGALGRTQVRHAARDHAITLLLNAITSAPN
ncbi:MAG: nicotinamide-nucleotide amidase [Gammaproteobacteria bacterium]